MRPDPNYPRWMFHRSKPMVMVQNPEEEAALGPGWSRTPLPPEPAHDYGDWLEIRASALPKEEPEPEPPEELPEEDDDEEEEDEESMARQEPAKVAAAPAPAPKKRAPVKPPVKPKPRKK